MELCSIDSASWIAPRNAKAELQVSGKVDHVQLDFRNLELNSIVRTARRDPKFFASLSRLPLETLAEIDSNLSRSDRCAIAKIIETDAYDKSSIFEQNFYRIWKLISEEYSERQRKTTPSR